ncbi:hypothetical protein J2X90_003727 [Variovorax paradoxus]|nr:hypothetical protein [Variovorax paradoxus]
MSRTTATGTLLDEPARRGFVEESWQPMPGSATFSRID